MSLCINPHCHHPNNPDNNRFCQSCGSELILMNRYRVTRLLSSKGGFAITYEVASETSLKVLKVLTHNHPKAIELFEKEAQVLNQLKHPGIPQGEGHFIYFPRDSDLQIHCLIMEKIEGIDLEEYQKQNHNQPISQELAIDWLFQLITILQEVHKQHFFHRDIKPSNIILRNNGQLTLIDFGSVRQVTKTILSGNQNTGIYTPGYAPPEQERGYAVPQSDFFAVGRTFVFLLTGKPPNDPEIYDYYKNELNWRKYATHISPRLANFIDHLMAESASQRPENTAIILRELEQVRKNLSIPIASPPNNDNLPVTIIKQTPEYAGFWKRFGAYIIDSFFILTSATILGGIIAYQLDSMDLNFTLESDDLISYGCGFTMLGTTILGLIMLIIFGLGYLINSIDISQEDFLIVIFLLIGIIFRAFYFIIFETAFKATFGKMILGIQVTNSQGKRLSLGKANQRYWGKMASTATLYIGFMMAGWNHQKRALHDLIADSIVIKK
jgi:eukaryotic-like serine/threonine-protein kinase